jgi:RNA-directed DNA polymerase
MSPSGRDTPRPFQPPVAQRDLKAEVIYCVGGVISPVMCNVYLHRLDRAWDEHDGVLARYADDLVVMCWSRSQAERALERLSGLLAGLGLEPKAAKTRIVHLEEGGEGFDFLGFCHRLVRSRGLNGKKPVTFLAR